MNYNILNDIYYTNFISSKPNITEYSKKNYRTALNKFVKATNTPLEKIVIECKNQQDRVIEKIINHRTDDQGNQIIEKQLIKFDVNNPNSKIKLYLNTHINYCKSRNNSNKTINMDITLITSFLKYYNITIPNMDTLKDDTPKWYLLTKEDFKYIINDSTLTQASLIKFLMSSGMRIHDACLLTIGDFMEATRDSHDFVDVNDFIDNAPSDMIGTWYFHPHKTMKFQVPCLTFNDPESSNFILQNLRKLKNHYLPYIKDKYGVEREMSKTDALFGSQVKYFTTALTPNNVAGRFWEKNKKLREYRINMIKERISNGELSEEDFEREVSKIPKFHAHACRKFFETVIAKNCGNLRICTLMEGHVSPVQTDSSYIKQDVDDVREYYMAAIDDFSLEKTEVKVYTSEIRKEMEAKINSLQNEIKEKEEQSNIMEDRLAIIEERLSEIDNRPTSRNSILKKISEQ